jgi:hypothetical protein
MIAHLYGGPRLVAPVGDALRTQGVVVWAMLGRSPFALAEAGSEKQ